MASQAGDLEFDAAESVSQSFNVVAPTAPKEAQSINFPKPADRTLGDPAFEVNATATSGLVVSIASNTPSVCTISNSTVSLLAVGTCTLVASQAGNDQFNPAPSVNQSFAVNAPNAPKEAQTIIFDKPADRYIGSAAFVIVASATSGLVVAFSSDTPTICTISDDTVTLLKPGTCTIAATQAGNAQYHPAPTAKQSFEVKPKVAQSIDFAQPAAHTEGDDPFSLSATASSGLAVLFTSTTPTICTVTGDMVTIIEPGTCTIVASQGGNSQYEAATAVTRDIFIRADNAPLVPQTISFPAPANRVLGDPPFVVTATAESGLEVIFASDSPTVCTVVGDVVTLVGVGICKLRATQTGNNTYEAASAVVQFIVSAAPEPPDTPEQLFLPNVTTP
jgi:hypothetical protein